MLTKQHEGRQVEYPVEPAEISKLLMEKPVVQTFDTGWLDENILRIFQKGETRIVIGWRPPQMTGIWVDGSDKPIRCPLPGLVLVRRSDAGQVRYRVFASKARPTLKDTLYAAPLPNVYENGNICWGTVQRPVEIISNTLDADWTLLLGSGFGNHAVNNKSKTHKADIREKLLELESRKARRYPVSDLTKTTATLEKLIHDERV